MLMKQVYFSDAQGQYAGHRDVGESYELQPGESFNGPSAEISNPVLVDDSWVAGSAVVPVTTPLVDPTPEMQAINALGLQVATLMSDKAAETTGGAN